MAQVPFLLRPNCLFLDLKQGIQHLGMTLSLPQLSPVSRLNVHQTRAKGQKRLSCFFDP